MPARGNWSTRPVSQAEKASRRSPNGKTCTKCGETKPYSEFGVGPRYADGYKSICKACGRTFPNWTPEAHLQNTYELRERNRKYVFEYLLTHPCVDCDESDPIVLEFDHVRGSKRKNVSQLIHGSCALATIQTEIDKCDVVCANCHRRRTADVQQWAKSVWGY